MDRAVIKNIRVKNMEELFGKESYKKYLEKEKRHLRDKAKVQKGWGDTEEELIENEDWLDVMMPYSDLVTLLLVFFIFFYIFNAFTSQGTSQAETIFEKKAMNDRQVEALDSNEVAIEKDKLAQLKNADQDTLGGLKEHVFTVSGGVLFESGSADLKRSAESTLRLIAMEIRRKMNNDPHWQIRVEGHTDNVPINTPIYKSNWELSTARAVSVVRFFVKNGYFKPDQLQAMGYGEHKPIASNETSWGRQKNRRVEIKLTYVNPSTANN